MTDRIDQASRVIRASPAAIYQALANAAALESWLPPTGMTGRVLAFDFREGGSYRMRLSYDEPDHGPGKTSDDADDVEVQFVKLIADERIEQAVTFDSKDPAFSGVMKMTWSFDPVGQGTEVSVRCENVPPGIRPEDHQAALVSTLDNLARFTE
jgi:uncharacterized protein YndB with AHSA1/START domain